MMKQEWLKKSHSNPFNWTGSKHRYLLDLFKVLPTKDNLKVLDVFLGGGDLISKLPLSWEIHGNDLMKEVYDLHIAVQSGIINTENISAAYKDRGMSKTNAEAFSSLRSEYNDTRDIELLYLLMTNSFNNQLRFNQKGGFNMPFGKDRSTFNPNMKAKLTNYSSSLKERNVTFHNKDYKDFDFSDFDLLLLDPPYANTVATYNETTGWGSKEDLELFNKIDGSGKDFIYFNQTWSKGVENKELVGWSKKYKVVVLKETSTGCNYQRKEGFTQEVLITNIVK